MDCMNRLPGPLASGGLEPMGGASSRLEDWEDRKVNLSVSSPPPQHPTPKLTSCQITKGWVHSLSKERLIFSQPTPGSCTLQIPVILHFL